MAVSRSLWSTLPDANSYAFQRIQLFIKTKQNYSYTNWLSTSRPVRSGPVQSNAMSSLTLRLGVDAVFERVRRAGAASPCGGAFGLAVPAPRHAMRPVRRVRVGRPDWAPSPPRRPLPRGSGLVPRVPRGEPQTQPGDSYVPYRKSTVHQAAIYTIL